jgi:hypothetical protein
MARMNINRLKIWMRDDRGIAGLLVNESLGVAQILSLGVARTLSLGRAEAISLGVARKLSLAVPVGIGALAIGKKLSPKIPALNR